MNTPPFTWELPTRSASLVGRRPATLKTKLAVSLVLISVLGTCAFAQVPQAHSGSSPSPAPAPDAWPWPPGPNILVNVTYDAPSNIITPVEGGFLGADGKLYKTGQELLAACGVKFEPGSSVHYVPGIRKLVVRDTIENQNIIRKLYNLPAIPPNVGKTKLPDGIVAEISLKDASLSECIRYFQKKSMELDPKKNGVGFMLDMTNGVENRKVTLHLTNVLYSAALKQFASLANVDVISEDTVIEFIPRPAPTP